MFRSLACASAALLACAQLPNTLFGYDWEVDFSVTDEEVSSDHSYEGSLRYYFSPLDSGSAAPWAEIDFVERIAFVEGKASYQERNDTFAPVPDVEPVVLENERKTFSGAYVYRNPNSRHSFAAELGYTDIDSENVVLVTAWDPGDPLGTGGYRPVPTYSSTIRSSNQSIFRYGLGYDYYLEDQWTIGSSVALTEYSFADAYTLALKTNKLWNIGNQQWVGVRAGANYSKQKTVISDGEFWTYRAEGRFYFSPRTRISLGFELPESGLIDIYTFSVQHFFAKNIFAEAGARLTKFDYPLGVQPDGTVPDDSFTDYQVRFGMRF